MKKKMTAPESIEQTRARFKKNVGRYAPLPPPPAPSALPWKHVQDEDTEHDILTDNNGRIIARFENATAAGWVEPTKGSTANAALICEAVNQHPALTARIKELEGVLGRLIARTEVLEERNREHFAQKCGESSHLAQARAALQGGNP